MNNEHLWNNSKSDESDQWFYILCASDLNLLMKFLIAVNICWQKNIASGTTDPEIDLD